MYQILFFVFALMAVGFAVNLIVQRHPIHSALSLIGVMASLSALFLMLGAEFLALVQVIVYAGAIMVLFVFVIMLLNAAPEERTDASRLARWLGIPLVLLFGSALAAILYFQFPQSAVVRFGDFPGQTAEIGRRLFFNFLLPFEVISVLILIAIVGAVVLGRKRI